MFYPHTHTQTHVRLVYVVFASGAVAWCLPLSNTFINRLITHPCSVLHRPHNISVEISSKTGKIEATEKKRTVCMGKMKPKMDRIPKKSRIYKKTGAVVVNVVKKTLSAFFSSAVQK